MKQLGCSTLLYRNFSLAQALDGIRKAGGYAVELCGRPSGDKQFTHLDLNLDDEFDNHCKSIQELIAQNGLWIESIAINGRQLDHPLLLERLIIATGLLNVQIVTVNSGGVADNDNSFSQFVEKINRVSSLLSKSKVRLSIKPRVGRSIHDVPSIQRLMTEVNNQQVGINFDPTHLYRSQVDPVQALNYLEPYVLNVRIRDHQLSQEAKVGPVETQIPGNGVLDLAGITNKVKQLPNITAVVLEIVGLHKSPQPSLESVQNIVSSSFNYLKPLMFEYVATPMTTII